ncbi:MAG: MoaD/ThiS family protein [Candidatus Heimdallarchaeota archaeon]|nr:MoaD/ThiS family protein [Candidatus Heimdallarchaeota archaeon]
MSSLKRIVGFDLKEIEISKPTPLREIIDLNLPDERIVVIINETQGGTMDSIINNDDYVMLSPLFGGG